MPTSTSGLSMFAPPYTELSPFTPDLNLNSCRGQALVWYLHDATRQRNEYELLLRRPPRVPLFIVLPPAEAIEAIVPIVPLLNDLQARAVLPNGPLQTVEPIVLLLRHAPRDLPAATVSYLSRRMVLRDAKTRALVNKIFELAPSISSISALARRLYTSRRTLGRFFESKQLPVPSHWLQFARLLYVATRLQADEDTPVFKVATQFRYPDGFTMSNQMKRLVGCRPTDVRQYLGYEWFIEDWLALENNRTPSE